MPRARAARTVARMTRGSPACAPQAMLAEETSASTSSAPGMLQRPKPSPRSALRSMTGTRTSLRAVGRDARGRAKEGRVESPRSVRALQRTRARLSRSSCMDRQVPIDPGARADRTNDGVTHEVASDVAYCRIVFVNVVLFGALGAGDASWVLVDAGPPNEAGAVERAAAERFGEDGRPAANVVTHGHS